MMVDPGQAADGDAALDPVWREALDWMRRLGSGEVTTADLEALDRWRMASQQHRRAFAEANLLWDVLGKTAREAKARDLADQSARHSGRIGRRALLAGAAAASIAYGVVRPPLGLWPSMAELVSDYHTSTGEQKSLEVSAGITIDMNTQTSVSAPVRVGQHYALELVGGEVAVSVRAEPGAPLRIAAAGGQIEANSANFNVRRDRAVVCVTCTEGAVRVRGPSVEATLAAGQQVSYGDGVQQPVIAVDATVVTAWKRGMLIFRDVPLAQVIAELNRYRPGKIILLNQALAKRSVVAGFRIDQIGEAVNYLSRAVGARARAFPGGVVVLT